MQIGHVKVLLKYILLLMFLKFQNHMCFQKINIGCNGTENNHTFSRACDAVKTDTSVIGILFQEISTNFTFFFNKRLHFFCKIKKFRVFLLLFELFNMK